MEREKQLIKKLRAAIRMHRDQKGDDRCWLDDFLLWKLIPRKEKDPKKLPPIEEAMKKCIQFYERRGKRIHEGNKKVNYSDEDLEIMNKEELVSELNKIAKAIRNHRDRSQRTWKDDQKLYDVLPEKEHADFYLPPRNEFIGGEQKRRGCGDKASGCPNFWKSHKNCKTEEHNLHQWGPCN